MQGIQDLLDESIAADPFKIRQTASAYGQVDLSKINFEALRKRFESKKPSNTDVERLKTAVKAQLERMVRLNPTRADYLEKFQELIESYNSGSRNIEETFEELLALTAILSDELMRHVRENMSEKEQTIFDILNRPMKACRAYISKKFMSPSTQQSLNIFIKVTRVTGRVFTLRDSLFASL